MHQEIIGYVERAHLEARCALPEAGILSAAHYSMLLDELQWGVRAPLEQDPSKKQLIPYVVVTRGEHIWVMRRKRAQSEARLHDRLSVGVGGHLDQEERGDEDPVMSGARREFGEEVRVEGAAPMKQEWSYVGLLNDDRDEVGKVHLGVVFHLELPQDHELHVREQDKIEGRWMRREEIDVTRLETWSQLVIDAMYT